MTEPQMEVPMQSPLGNPVLAGDFPLKAVGDAELTGMGRVLTRRLKEARHLRMEIDSLKKSLCWRITSPLRLAIPDPEAHAHNEAPRTERAGAPKSDAAAGRGTGSKPDKLNSHGEQNAIPGDSHTCILQREINEEEARIRHLEAELRRLKSSASWQITAPVRWLNQMPGHCAELLSSAWEVGAALFLRLQLSANRWKNRLSSAPQSRKRIVYISGEPNMPGHTYRVEMGAAALATRGCEVHTIPIGKVIRFLPLLEIADVVVIWRAGWSEKVRKAVDASRRGGARLIFDLDDLVMDPSLAREEIVDCIRTGEFDREAVAGYYLRNQKTLRSADLCTASTETLALAMRRFGKPVFVIPNGFDEQTYQSTRSALEKRRAADSDGLIRLGYAGGTRTHQRDFGAAAPAIARILREHAECRLVVFRKESAEAAQRCIDLEEFPEMGGLESQIEWRLVTPLRNLPYELVRFEINLAPLEIGNAFCEAKSELKYFEAALANIPTVASPTSPFAQAIRHGETGFLASNTDEWHACLKQLVTDPKLRRRIGEAAFSDVLSKYGPACRAELAGAVMEQALGLPRC